MPLVHQNAWSELTAVHTVIVNYVLVSVIAVITEDVTQRQLIKKCAWLRAAVSSAGDIVSGWSVRCSD